MCQLCTTCDSPTGNSVQGNKYIRLDDGTYVNCDTPVSATTGLPRQPDPALDSWWNLSVVSRQQGAVCVYAPPCLEWTGLRPYKNPQLEQGVGFLPGDTPSGRVGHGAALVLNTKTGERDTMLMFGGASIDCLDYCNDTWVYSVPHNLWSTPATIGTAPARRWKHAMVDYLDSAFLFGGYGQRLPYVASASARLPNEKYDLDNSGYDATIPLFFGDLWQFNFSQATSAGASWTLLNTSASPGGVPRPRHSASLVAYQDCLYLFGGLAYGGTTTFAYTYPTPFLDVAVPNTSAYNSSLLTKYYLADTWQFNITQGRWHLLNTGPKPVGAVVNDQFTAAQYASSSASPGVRAGHSAAMSLRGSDAMMLLFGGNTWDDQIGDAWQMNMSSFTWTVLTGEGTFPSRRRDMVMVPVGQQAVRISAGAGSNAGSMLLGFGLGCLSGSSYVAASNATTPAHLLALNAYALSSYTGFDTSLSRSGNGTITAFGSYVNASTGQTVYASAPDLWVETSPTVGEKFCVEFLDDLWEYSPAACPADCSRHGTCTFNACLCDPGFWGADCSQVSCPGSVCVFDYGARTTSCVFCTGRGSCDGLAGTCLCNTTLLATGSDCALATCLNGCSGNGLCDNNNTNAAGYGTCTCSSGYTGDDCSQSVCATNPSVSTSLVCSGNGLCLGGQCSCFPGYGDSIVFQSGGGGTTEVPIFAENNSLIPGCGFEGMPGCYPEYVADCGSLMFIPSRAAREGGPARLATLLLLALTVLAA